MTQILGDDIIESGRVKWDNREDAEWEFIRWMVEVEQEITGFPAIEWLRECADAWFTADAYRLQDKLRIGRCWIEHKDDYPNMGITHLRECMKGGEPDFELAEWASEYSARGATVNQIRDKKAGVDGLPYWQKKLDRVVKAFNDLLETEELPGWVASAILKFIRLYEKGE
mgnify:CR=1 FL=1